MSSKIDKLLNKDRLYFIVLGAISTKSPETDIEVFSNALFTQLNARYDYTALRQSLSDLAKQLDCEPTEEELRLIEAIPYSCFNIISQFILDKICKTIVAARVKNNP